MTETRHGKIPDWYNKNNEYEEAFHEDTPNSRTTNRIIEKILRMYKVIPTLLHNKQLIFIVQPL